MSSPEAPQQRQPSHRFQVNLGGIIDLLSHHLYTGPHVFVRELLQNAVDAITARRKLDPCLQGKIQVEIVSGRDGQHPTIVFEDNGIGLTEDEIHRFVATIGSSSKRDELETSRREFIGQFGIGLLSCFTVVDEVVMVSRHAGGTQGYEWRGNTQGTYTVRAVEASLDAGTRVYLRARKDRLEFFAGECLRGLLHHFGSLLDVEINLKFDGRNEVLPRGTPPWRLTFSTERERRIALSSFGRTMFGQSFLDAVDLQAESGLVRGVAYVLSSGASLAAKQSHRVYLRGMFLTDAVDNLLPPWAFFVRCVIDSDELRPTASREGLHSDPTLEDARDQLGNCLRDYVMGLASENPGMLNQLIAVHCLAFKALAVEDAEFYRLIIRWLPFETAAGRMTLDEYLAGEAVIRFVSSVDQFRQIAAVSAAQGKNIINAGYVYDCALLTRLNELDVSLQIEELQPADLIAEFADVEAAEAGLARLLNSAATEVLRPFRCCVEVRRFSPENLGAVLNISAEAQLARDVEQSKDVANSHWAGVLDRVAQVSEGAGASLICFNFANPLVRRLAEVRDPVVLKLAIEMVYVQALLLGHHPLKSAELRLLNEGLANLIQLALGATKGKP